MHHGHYIARNIHQTVTKQVFPEYEPEFMELVPYPSVIGLAVGKEAVAYSPDSGTISGEDVAQAYFGGDLGFTGECKSIATVHIHVLSSPAPLTVSI